MDLRGFLDQVRRDRKRDLIEIEREVSPRYETTAILMKRDSLMHLGHSLARRVTRLAA